MTKDRLYGADFMRAVACLTVLFHHLAQRMNWDINAGPVLNGFRSFAQMGTYGVAIFFVLSGFLLARPFWLAHDQREPMPNLRVYAMRRAARILPGFWLALAVTFVLSIALFGAVLDSQLVLRFVSGALLLADWHWVTFFPVEVNGPLWSISFEATSYVLLPLGFAVVFLSGALLAGWRARLAWVGIIGIVLVGHWLFLTYYPIDNIRRSWEYGLMGGAKWWMPRYNPIGFFAMFAMGALAAGLQVSWARRRHWAFDLAGIAGMAAAVYVVLGHIYSRVDSSGFGWLEIPYGFPWFQLSIALVLATLPASVVVGRLLDNPVTRYIATISFGIYVWHYLVMELVRLYWVPDFYYRGVSDMTLFVVICGVVSLVTLAIAHLSWHLVEKPAIDWARRQEGTGRARLSPQAAE